MHSGKRWLNVGRGFFIAQIIKIGHFTKMIYHIVNICGKVFYKTLSLKGDSYIFGWSNPHSFYTASFFGSLSQ